MRECICVVCWVVLHNEKAPQEKCGSHHQHPDPLFKLIADARPPLSQYLSTSIVPEDDGSIKPHDYTFELGDQFVKAILEKKSYYPYSLHEYLKHN